MRRYFYRYGAFWMSCGGTSKAQVGNALGEFAEEVLTEREAEERAKTDEELADAISAAALCDLMCN
jgi:hypothetical protein